MTLRVLLIEDQHDLAGSIWDYLEPRGVVVDHAADGETGLRRALEEEHDIIVLDLGLPKLDGLDLCRRLRTRNLRVGVLMLTARDTLTDKLKGLREGADDYLVKPFAMRELEARIRALHRRIEGLEPGAVLRVADLEFDRSRLRVRRGGQVLDVTRSGLKILELLMRRAPAIVSHAELERALWGKATGKAAALHTHIHGLRSAIDRPFSQALLRTVSGVGYCLSADD